MLYTAVERFIYETDAKGPEEERFLNKNPE